MGLSLNATRWLTVVVALTALTGCGKIPGVGSSGSGFIVPPDSTNGKAEKPGFANLVHKNEEHRALVVMYHDVVGKKVKLPMYFDTPVADFLKDLKTIEDSGAKIVPLRDVYDALVGKKPLTQNVVAITFDDGYIGVYDNVLPILKKKGITATVFIHTGFIGSQKTRPKMSLDQLIEIDKSGVIDVESHTVTHPEDITLLPPEKLRKELVDSKVYLETALNKKIDFLSWPMGKNDSITQLEAKDAGYKMAVTMHDGLAQHSPDIMAVNRCLPKYLADNLEELSTAPPVSPLELAWRDAPVSLQQTTYNKVDLLTITGGKPSSVLIGGRSSVADLVDQFGGVAGINGGFFSMSAIDSTDNMMIGPCKAANMEQFVPDLDAARVSRLADRPLVVWNDSTIKIVPFSPGAMNDQKAIEGLLPGSTDLFVAGAWLVTHGKALDSSEFMGTASPDAMDPRKRAFFGVTEDGRLIVGATKNGATSEMLARAAVNAGAYCAVLIDSGFSTSLVIDHKTLAWGHQLPSGGSRPVPHAIVIKGTLDPELDTTGLDTVEATKPVIVGEKPHRHKKPKTTQ